LSETKSENDTHIAKYGVSPTKRLYDMGILGNDMIAAHSLWLSDEDIAMYAEKGVTAVHNINSNLKLASGYRFRYNELKQAGVNVAIGTDGAGSSNNLDMLEAMKTSAIVQKAWREDPAAMPLNELMDMGSANGAKALGLDMGRIEEGALADMLLIDMNSTFFIPNFDFKANFIYSANSSCIDTVICDGNILMEGRKVEGEEQIMEEAAAQINKFIELVK
jgi:5-methylthioadenosine/S-adenosylhomocysteine deaminase